MRRGVLKAHPFALLVLMRRMFTWRQIPKMLELKELLLTAIAEHPELSPEERGNLLGECDLILSFLCYNDISAMSRLHRSASAQMSRPAISIHNSGGWTFGSPSVLMMFHRTRASSSGSWPRWTSVCRTTTDHQRPRAGRGKDDARRGGFCAGRFTDAQIALESAYAQIRATGRRTWPSAAIFWRGGCRSAPIWAR